MDVNKKNNRIIIWGAGNYAHRVMPIVEEYYEVDFLCDNKREIQNTLFDDKYLILSPKDMFCNYNGQEVYVALDNIDYFREVSEQLKNQNIYCKHINQGIYDACYKNSRLFYIDKNKISKYSELYEPVRKIFVLTSPSHSNLGDQAQSLCIEEILQREYTDCTILIYDELSIMDNFYELLYMIRQNISNEDRVFLHSGYRLTNLYMSSENILEMMLEIFEHRKMVFLPQTINYTYTSVAKRIKDKVHEGISIMCRDETSYAIAKEMFIESKVELYPDVVTSLIGRYKFKNRRNGILLVLREDDDESITSKEDVDTIIKAFETHEVDIADTTIDEEWTEVANNRKKYVEREIEKYSRYKLIITNRYHGTIFSLISNTPVIVIPTNDHKIVSGIKWFEKAGYKSICLCNSIDEVIEQGTSVLSNIIVVDNNDYFFKKYYENTCLDKYFN